jgi:hypothetical protein
MHVCIARRRHLLLHLDRDQIKGRIVQLHDPCSLNVTLCDLQVYEDDLSLSLCHFTSHRLDLGSLFVRLLVGIFVFYVVKPFISSL